MLVHAGPSLVPFPVLLLIVAVALWPWRLRPLLLAFAFGVVLTQWQAQRVLDRQWPEARYNQEHWVRGRIASLPERSASSYGDGSQIWRFTFATHDAAAAALPARMRVSWYGSDAKLAGNQCWRFLLRLRSPHGSLNPGGFDYEAWLFRQGLGATATVRDAEPCGRAGGHPILDLRQRWTTRVDTALGTRPGAALLKALTVGATADLRDADWNAFRRTGTTHLIAISGFNLALVAGVAFFVLRWAWSCLPRACLWIPAQRVALIGAAGFALFYALLAGFEPPVARAAFMLLALLVAALAHRLSQAGHALAFAWLAILIVDPFAVMAPGLWLSFGAVLSIYYIAAGRYRPDPAWRAALRMQLFLSLVLAPLTLYYFHGLAWGAPFINLLAVPLFAVLTPAALLVMVAASLSAAVAHWVLVPSAVVLEWLLQALQWLAVHWPHAWVPAAPPLAALVLAMVGAVLLFAPAGLPLRATGVLCLMPLCFPPRPSARGGLEISALDVGQGLSVLVQTPHHRLLYDAGPAFGSGFDAGESVVAPFALNRGVRALDMLVLSHGDNDHAGGVPAVRRLLQVDDEIGTSRGQPCADGRHWQWDGVKFTIWQPDPGSLQDNDASCILKIDGPFSVLLPGDIEQTAESDLLAQHPGALHADVLLAPHHGSNTSSTPAFVEAVAPQLVIFPAGWHNRFGHPRPPVVRRYRDCDVRMVMTGESGAVSVWRRDGGALAVEAWRDIGRHFWNAAPEPRAYWRRAAASLPHEACGG
nr:DNA internalization-related competence protein ComEC/Rec2 [Solimonas marina]